MAQDLRGGGPVLAAPSHTPPPASIDWTVEETRKKVDANVDAWIVKMKKELSKLEKEEEKASKQYAVESVRKPLGGVEPQLFGTRGNDKYKWTIEGANALTLHEYTALWKENLTVDAYLKANGYCFTYAVGHAINVSYKTVRAKVKEAMEKLLNEGRNSFR
jgi:hypothetical protein